MPFHELEPGAVADGDPRLNRILDLLESMDGRMSRLEGQVAELTHTTQLAPAFVAGVTDTVDHHIAAAAERGVDVDAHVRSSVQLVEALTEPATVATVSRMLDRMDLIEQSLAVAEQLPDMAAGAVDTVDRLILAASESGIDIDARLRASLALAERLTDPTTVEALLQVTEHAPQLAEATAALSQAPGMIAGAVDTVDLTIARMAASGIDVDARLQAVVAATERLTDPAVLASLTTLADKAPQLEEAVAIAEQLPGMAAGAMDTVDGLVAQLQSTGVDLDARLKGVLALTETATRPEAMAALDRLLSKPEALHQLADLAEHGPGMVAGAIDTFDGLMGRLHASGIDVDARLHAVLEATEALTDPAVLATLTQLAGRTDDLKQALDMAEQLPGMVAGAMDTFDSLAAQVSARGIDLDERLGLLVRAAESLTDPVIINLLQAVLDKGPELTRLVDTLFESGVFDEKAVDLVGSTGLAVVETRGANPAPVGAFGAAFSIFDKDVQRSLGFAIHFAQIFGRKLEARRA